MPTEEKRETWTVDGITLTCVGCEMRRLTDWWGQVGHVFERNAECPIHGINGIEIPES